MADIITRLLLDTKNFDAKLDRSKSSVNSFQGGISNMAKTAKAGVLKFAGAIGVAVGASEAFVKTINSTQTTGDAWVKMQDQMKASVDSFFASIAMGNFDGFLSNLQNVIDKAGDLSTALDNLGTKTLFNNSEVNDLNTKYQIELNKAKARNLSDEERNEHLQKAKGYLIEMVHLQSSLATANKETSYIALQADMAKQGFNRNVSKEVWEYLLKDSNRADVENKASSYKNTISNYESRISNSQKFDAWLGEWVNTSESDRLKVELNKFKNSASGKFGEMAATFLELADDEKSAINSAIKMRATANSLNVAISQRELEIANTDARINGSYNSQNGNGNGKTPPPATGLMSVLNEQIAVKNKELLNATTVQTRAEIQKTINELEARKISLNIATEKEVFRDKYGENKLDATKAQKQFSEYINVDKEISAKSKELTNATTEQARVAVQKTISELEEKKIRLKVSIEKEIQTNSVDSKTKKDFTEYISVEEDIAKQNTQLINSTTEQARTAVQSTINELEARKIQISANISLKPDLSSEMVGVLNNGSIDREGKQVTKGSNATDISKIKLPKYEPIFKKEDIDLNNDFADSLSGIGDMMGSLSSLFDENTASALQWGSTLLMAIAQATPAILGMMGVKEQDTATTNKNTTAEVVNAGAKVMSAHSSIPFVGIALGLAGVAAIIAAMSSMPHFATGGIVPGTSFTGDKVPALLNSGEMILNGAQQGNLFKILNGGMYDSLSRTISPLPENSEIRLSSNITVRGDTLYLALNNYMKRTGKKL